MKLSKGALSTLRLIGEGIRSSKQIALLLKKSIAQTHRYLKELREADILDKEITLTHTVITSLLLRTIESNKQIIPILADSGIAILANILEPKTAKEITSASRITAYKKLQQAGKFSIIKKEKNKYSINRKIWPDLYKLLIEIKSKEEEIDKNVPIDSIIYKKENIMIFSNKYNVNAQKTAFSLYPEYKINILTTTNYFCLPKKNLTYQDIFDQSMIIAKKEGSIRLILFAILFYLKFRNKIKRDKAVEIILAGKVINGYPSKKEIEEKAELYDIRI